MTDPATPLAGKVAYVTGAARGQGRSHCIRLARAGADIIAIDACAQVAEHNGYAPALPEDLAETVSLVEGEGRKIVADEVDVRDLAGQQRVVIKRDRTVRPARHRGGQRRRAELGPAVGDFGSGSGRTSSTST